MTLEEFEKLKEGDALKFVSNIIPFLDDRYFSPKFTYRVILHREAKYVMDENFGELNLTTKLYAENEEVPIYKCFEIIKGGGT
jgi:hypothetical protein